MQKTTKTSTKKRHGGHQNFNNILKEELGSIFNAFFMHYFNVDKNANLRDLNEAKVHRTVARDPDFLKILLDENGKDLRIFHLEIHKKDEYKVIHRCCEFDSMKVRELDLEIVTVILYIGKKPCKNIPSVLNRGSVQYRMTVIDFSSESMEQFLNAENPAAVLWSILCDFEGKSPESVIKTIVERLDSLSPDPVD